MSGEFQFNKRFNDLGRNFTVRFTFNSTKGSNDSYSYSDQKYYQDHSRDSIMNRFNVSPTDNSSWSGRIMWSEPIDSGRGNLQFRYNFTNSNINLGVNFMPQYTGMDNFQYMGKVIGDTSRVVYNWSPSLNYRYSFDRQRSLQATLRNNFEINYQNYITETQKTINLRLSLENSLRNIAQKTDYDPNTGISVTQPQNMEGFRTNWSTSGNLTYNQTIPNTKWRYNASANVSYRHQESYMRTRNPCRTSGDARREQSHDGWRRSGRWNARRPQVK